MDTHGYIHREHPEKKTEGERNHGLSLRLPAREPSRAGDERERDNDRDNVSSETAHDALYPKKVVFDRGLKHLPRFKISRRCQGQIPRRLEGLAVKPSGSNGTDTRARVRMNIRLKKLLGTVAFVFGTACYFFFAITVALARLPGTSMGVQLLFYLVTTLIWLFFAAILVRWMVKPVPSRAE